MQCIGHTFLRKSVASLGLAFLFLTSARAYADFDIAGIRIGMSEEQAVLALKAYNGDGRLRVTKVMSVTEYSDGVRVLESPRYLDRIFLAPVPFGNNQPEPELSVYFSGPPASPTVVRVFRHARLTNPPTQAQFIESLKKKYGEPAKVAPADGTGVLTNPSENNASSMIEFVWDESGRTPCESGDYNYLKNENHRLKTGRRLESPFSFAHAMEVGRGRNWLAYLNFSIFPKDLTQCGAFTVYRIQQMVNGGGPVKEFYAYLVDVGAVIASERRTAAWIDGFKHEAVQKREARGQMPKL